jgi:hypothetical protein
MTGGSNGAAKPAVTQRDLEEFLALKRELTSLKRRYTLARERLLQLVDGHAPVEPGRLQVEVRASAQQLITKAFLVSVLGEEDYEAMRGEAPPTVYRRLVVGERARRRAPSPTDWVRARTWTSFVREDRP